MVVVSVLGALGTAVLLAVTAIGGAAHVPSQARSTASSAPVTFDPSAISAIPDSVARAKDLSGRTVVSQPAIAKRSAKTGSASSKTAENSPKPITQTPKSASSSSAAKPGGTITAGDSKANCVSLNFPGGVFSQSMVDAVTSSTGITYNCLNVFDNPMPTWADWEDPWMFRISSDGWDAWLAANSQHQVIMGEDLIPQSVSNTSDPLSWEQSCASGDYDQYATALAKNLVSYGAGNIVIRLGPEANGNWEADYVGSTTQEMSDWAQCYANEVTAMRAVPGANFLFVWNPNVCTTDLPLSAWYPGNSYVDIIGVDAYDVDCSTLKTVSQEGWTAYSTDSATNTPNDPSFPSLDNIEAFAAANGKPLSFPEWGIDTGMPDDPTYVTDMAQMFSQDDFSFESYFDMNDDGIAPLGSSIPNATAAYVQGFG